MATEKKNNRGRKRESGNMFQKSKGKKRREVGKRRSGWR